MLGGSGDDSAKEQQGAAADPVSCGYLQSGMQEAEEARPAQEPACGGSSTDSLASSDISESNTSRNETEGGERGDTTEASGQKESADLKRVLNGADPSALEERRGEIEGKEGQVVAESNSHLRLTPSASLGGQGQPPLPTSSSRKLDDKQQSGSQNRNWDMRTSSNSTPTLVAQKRKREESEVRGLEADGSKLFLRVGVCRWASVPVLSVDPGQPGDAPLMGRIANWPSSTLLLQAHAAADGWVSIESSATNLMRSLGNDTPKCHQCNQVCFHLRRDIKLLCTVCRTAAPTTVSQSQSHLRHRRQGDCVRVRFLLSLSLRLL